MISLELKAFLIWVNPVLYLILKSMKKIRMQKLQEVAVTAKGDISLCPRAGNETFVYMSTSLGEAKHEIDTADWCVYYRFWCDIGLSG